MKIFILLTLLAIVFAQTVVNTTPACNEHPTCKWSCDDPSCPAQCHPICDRPKCEMQCEDTPCAQCKVHCPKPICEVRCPKDMCEKSDCPKCETVCQPAQCTAVCASPEPKCVPACEPTKCEWSCNKPVTCPRPQCQLVCEEPKCPETKPKCCDCTQVPHAQLAVQQADFACQHLGKCPIELKPTSFMEIMHEFRFQDKHSSTCCPCS